jgi:hypothetical protein
MLFTGQDVVKLVDLERHRFRGELTELGVGDAFQKRRPGRSGGSTIRGGRSRA